MNVNDHRREKCEHGYIKSQCRCPEPRVDIIVPCEEVPACPVIPVKDDDVRYPVELTRDEMALIRGAMAGMGALPIAQRVRNAMNEGEADATRYRVRVSDLPRGA